MNIFDKDSKRLPGPKRQLRHINLRRIDDGGYIIAAMEDRGRVYARTYHVSLFGDADDSEIIKCVRRDFRDDRSKFKPYNESTGHYMT